jgi:hypothetical protein
MPLIRCNPIYSLAVDIFVSAHYGGLRQKVGGTCSTAKINNVAKGGGDNSNSVLSMTDRKRHADVK